MILAIDIGNSNIVLGCVREDQILFEARMATDQIKTSDQYCAELKNMLELFHTDLNAIEGVILSSVVPPVQNSVRTALRKLLGEKPCMIVGPGLKTGLNILVDSPAQVGSDLIVAAVAAIRDYGSPLIIVDMGTATTMSVIDRKGCYLGGCICPGVKISLEALTSRTAQLPGINLDTPKAAIGRNTVDCMRSGMMYGTASMLDGMIQRMEEELGYSVTVVATGGLSKFIIPLCKHEIIYDPDLLLKGLNQLYKNNVRAINRERE